MKNLFIVFSILVGFFAMSCGTAYSEFNPKRSLQKYEYFKDTYSKIEATAKNIKSSEANIADLKETYGPAKNWGWETKDEYSRLQSVRRGYISLYNGIVAEYNSYSSKFNWKMYKSSLPRTCVEYAE